MKIVNKNMKLTKFFTRILLAVLLLAVLGGSMTSCMSGAGQITSIKKGYSISDSMITEDAGMTAVALDHLHLSGMETAKRKPSMKVRNFRIFSRTK